MPLVVCDNSGVMDVSGTQSYKVLVHIWLSYFSIRRYLLARLVCPNPEALIFPFWEARSLCLLLVTYGLGPTRGLWALPWAAFNNVMDGS